MSINKRVRGDYLIKTIGEDGLVANEVIITTDTMRVNGNLVIEGDTTEVVTTDLNIEDKTIVLNRGETGAGITGLHSGFEVERGTEPNVGIRYDDEKDAWMLTQDGIMWQYIVSGLTNSNTGIMNVVEDLTPQLGGDLDVNGMSIVSDVGDIRLNTNGNGEIFLEDVVVIENQPDEPLPTANHNKIYASEPSSGGTGLFFVNQSKSDEFISRSKAMLYSIIF